MPMDYDDNDTSRHNLQFAGEGRSRSSSALRPYDFPKFDFDDSLQGHLRFDSVVETEVFLGIQSQEDNQWIEDFSRGSNGMEFNSTPADSCSISRRNNVWSEATSSESVEMLLKSVGQEEMMPGASIIPNSDATHDQVIPSKHEDTSIKLKEGNAYVANSDTALTSGEVLEDCPAIGSHMEEQLEEFSATHAMVESACGNSGNVSENSLCGNGGSSSREGDNSYHDKCPCEKLEASQTSVGKSMKSGSGLDSLGFSSITDNFNPNIGIVSTSSDQVKFNTSHEIYSNDGHESQVFTMTAQEDAAIFEGKADVSSIHICTGSSSLGLILESDKDCQEASLDFVRGSTSILAKGDFELKLSDGDHKNTSLTTSFPTEGHEKVCAESNDVDEPFVDGQGGSSIDTTQHSAELDSLNPGLCVSSERDMDLTMQSPDKRDNDLMEVVSAVPLNHESVSVMPSHSIKDNEVLMEKVDCISDTDFNMQSSEADHEHTKDIEGCQNECLITGEDFGANILAHDKDVSIHYQADFSGTEKDICKIEDAGKELPTDVGSIDSVNLGALEKDLKTPPLEVGIRVAGNNVTHILLPQTSGESNSGNNVSPHAISNASTALGDCPEIGQIKPTAIGLCHSDNDREEAETKISNDANIGPEVDGISKAEVSMADESDGIPFSEIAAKSHQSVDKSNDVCSDGPSSVEAANSLCTNHPQLQLNFNGSNLKEIIDSDLVSGENHAEAITEEERKSLQIADIDKTCCGSPTIISSSEPSQTEKDNQEEVRGQVTIEAIKDTQSTSEDSKRKDLLRDDSSFTFKVNALPDMTEREPAKNWSPIPDVEKCKAVEDIALSSKGKTEKMPLQKTPRHNARVSDGETGPGSSKGASERKGRRGSAKGTAKESAKKGNQSTVPIQENASMKMEKNMLLSTPTSSTLVDFGQMEAYKNNDTRDKKPSEAVTVPVSTLPDLNTSALNSSTLSSASFQPPFTDLQQVQLRAQIFVYGSLIQGTAPDEACMISAFGPYDGGRSTWEPIWRVAIERVRNQKSITTSAETPSCSHSGARASDAVKQGSHSGNVLATPVTRACGKDSPAAALNSMIPLSSPLWNFSTPTRDSLTSNAIHKGPVVAFQQAVTPAHSYQTPPIRNFVGPTSGPSQPCSPAPWLVSPAVFSSSVRFRPVTMTETVKSTPVNDTSAVFTSSVKHTISSPVVHNVSPRPALGRVSALQDPILKASAEKHTVDSFPRKRKKAPATDPGQVSVSGPNTEALVLSEVATLPSLPKGVSASACRGSDAISSRSAMDISRVSSVDHPKKVDVEMGKADACSEEMLSKVAEAKGQAEDAADFASAAVSHCEDMWSQLAKQKHSGLTSEAEAKLASAAVAIAAAASVAKAAAAAAKIASNAALQAKLMADEAFLSSKTNGINLSSGKSYSHMHGISNANPASIFNSNNVSDQSSSILLAAKEAAKRRVEAASAASRQAENLDAIVKAAELAASAVSQAGKIVAMGEPLPLNDLIEAGPEGYWKSSRQSAFLGENVRDGDAKQLGAVSLEKDADISSTPAEVSVESIADVVSKEGLNGSLNLCMSSAVGIMGSKRMDGKDFRTGIDHSFSGTSKFGGVAYEPNALHSTTIVKNDHEELGTYVEEVFKEGSPVEVFKPGNGQKSAWYAANVLNIEDGKAFVCYNDLLSEEGSRNLREWVPLKGEGDKAPIIRAAHPSTALQYQQTRKRRRAALGDYAWCVGDSVDVWIDDCWWEGVVTEKNEKDETTLKVHIPAQGETPTVRAWNLRASLSWINGKWIELSSSRGQYASEQSDTPQEKRQKLEIPQSAIIAKDKESNCADFAMGKHDQSKSFTLSASERTFDIGKGTNDDKRGARRPLRTNQQKEGSRVIFGVPKPTGKKRKFMEVSKHFPANKSNKISEVKDPVKFTKYLIPQGAASRGWKVPSRNDPKEKRTAESRPRVVSTRKANRTLPQRENFRSTLTQDVDGVMDHGTEVEDSAGLDNSSEKSIYHGSNAYEVATEAPLSSLIPHSLSTASKKLFSSNTRSDRLNKGKPVPSAGKLGKIEDKPYSAGTDKSSLDVSEPRRSNRRIQPTHRLLEGLQSSMVIPKLPSVSQDKGRRNLPARGK